MDKGMQLALLYHLHFYNVNIHPHMMTRPFWEHNCWFEHSWVRNPLILTIITMVCRGTHQTLSGSPYCPWPIHVAQHSFSCAKNIQSWPKQTNKHKYDQNQGYGHHFGRHFRMMTMVIIWWPQKMMTMVIIFGHGRLQDDDHGRHFGMVIIFSRVFRENGPWENTSMDRITTMVVFHSRQKTDHEL